MKRGTPNHPKMQDLADRLGVRLYSATGIMEMLCHHVATYCPRGDIGKFSDKTIARAVDWDRDPEVLIEALISSGWVDKNDTHRLVVHDWAQHAEASVAKKLLRMEDKFIPECGVRSDADASASRQRRASRGAKAMAKAEALATAEATAKAMASDDPVVSENPDQIEAAEGRRIIEQIFRCSMKPPQRKKLQDAFPLDASVGQFERAARKCLDWCVETSIREPVAVFLKNPAKWIDEEPAAVADPEDDSPPQVVAIYKPAPQTVGQLLEGYSDQQFSGMIGCWGAASYTLTVPLVRDAWDRWSQLDSGQRERTVSEALLYCTSTESRYLKKPANWLETEPWTAMRVERILPNPPPPQSNRNLSNAEKAMLLVEERMRREAMERGEVVQ